MIRIGWRSRRCLYGRRRLWRRSQLRIRLCKNQLELGTFSKNPTCEWYHTPNGISASSSHAEMGTVRKELQGCILIQRSKLRQYGYWIAQAWLSSSGNKRDSSPTGFRLCTGQCGIGAWCRSRCGAEIVLRETCWRWIFTWMKLWLNMSGCFHRSWVGGKLFSIMDQVFRPADAAIVSMQSSWIFKVCIFLLTSSSYESQLRPLPQRKQEDRRNDVIDKLRANVPKSFGYLDE